MPTLPTDLAPAQRAAVEALLSEVHLVDDRPEHDHPEVQRSSEHCALCPRPTGRVIVFRLDARTDADVVVAHLRCRRRYLHRQRTARIKDVY